MTENGSGTTWVNNEKHVSTFDINNNEISSLYLTWNGSSWDSISRNLTSYNLNHKKTVYFFQQWWNGTWKNYQKDTIIYDFQNDDVYHLSENWNGSSWDTSSVTTQIFDGNHNNVSHLTRIWIFNVPININRSSRSYINNLETYQLVEEWDETNMSWVNQSQSFYSYGMNNNVFTDIKHQNWINNSWQEEYKYYLTFDSNQNVFSQVTFQTSYSNGNKMMFGDSVYNYFVAGLQGLNEISKEQTLFIFPNPSKTTLSIHSDINYNKVKIINAVGQIVWVSEDKLELISVADLSNGIYFIQLLDKKGTVLKTEKFIRE